MDGTLIDSERLWTRALDDTAAWLGGSLSDDVRPQMLGAGTARLVELVHEEVGVDGDQAVTAAYLNERVAASMASELAWRPGAPELLRAVEAAGVPAALVTSTERQLAAVCLDMIGQHYFAVTLYGDEVQQRKPHPEPYLTVASRLGVEPGRCVAIEDSPAGIAAAEAAGCTVLAVPSEVAIEPGPGRTVRSSLVGLTVDDLDALVRARLAG